MQVLGGEGVTAEEFYRSWIVKLKPTAHPKTTARNVEQQVTMGFYHFWEVSALAEMWQSSMNQNNIISFYLLCHLWRYFSKSWSCSLDNRIRTYKHKMQFSIHTPPSAPFLTDLVHEIKVSRHNFFFFKSYSLSNNFS